MMYDTTIIPKGIYKTVNINQNIYWHVERKISENVSSLIFKIVAEAVCFKIEDIIEVDLNIKIR